MGAWLDKASGEWVTGPEVAEHGGLTGRVETLTEETMADGNVRPTLVLVIGGRKRKVAVNQGAANVLRTALGKKDERALIGAKVTLTTEIARNPRTGVTGPAVRIAKITF